MALLSSDWNGLTEQTHIDVAHEVTVAANHLGDVILEVRCLELLLHRFHDQSCELDEVKPHKADFVLHALHD